MNLIDSRSLFRMSVYRSTLVVVYIIEIIYYIHKHTAQWQFYCIKKIQNYIVYSIRHLLCIAEFAGAIETRCRSKTTTKFWNLLKPKLRSLDNSSENPVHKKIVRRVSMTCYISKILVRDTNRRSCYIIPPLSI